MHLWLVPHPVVFVTHLGYMECMYICMFHWGLLDHPPYGLGHSPHSLQYYPSIYSRVSHLSSAFQVFWTESYAHLNPVHASMFYQFHPHSFDGPNNIWWSSLSCKFLKPSVISSPFGSHIILSALFSVKFNSSIYVGESNENLKHLKKTDPYCAQL